MQRDSNQPLWLGGVERRHLTPYEGRTVIAGMPNADCMALRVQEVQETKCTAVIRVECRIQLPFVAREADGMIRVRNTHATRLCYQNKQQRVPHVG